MDYCTTAQVHDYLPDLDATDDPVIAKVITRSSAAVDRICERTFDNVAGVVEIFDGRGFGSGYPRFFPNRDIVAVTQLRLRDTMQGAWRVVPPGDVLLEPNDRRAGWPGYWIALADFASGPDTVFPRGVRTIELTYTRGWPAVLSDVEEATLEIAVRVFKARGAGFADITGVEGIDTAITTKALPALGNEFLKHLKRKQVFA